MRALILVVTLFGSPAVAADQFDLVCQFGKTPVRYRVDLERREACQGECDTVWKVGTVTSGELTLKDTRESASGVVPQTIVVNRQTGHLRHRIYGIGRPLEETATCDAAQFTGFPASKF